MEITGAEVGDSICLAEIKKMFTKFSLARNKLAEDLKLIDENSFSFCWIVDYPMYELDENTKKIKFSHNPFSMPQGKIEDIDFNEPLNIKAYQYDIVCNELSFPREQLEITFQN